MTELNCNQPNQAAAALAKLNACIKDQAADFDIEGGNKPEAIEDFLQHIYSSINAGPNSVDDDTVLIMAAGKIIKLYDHAALIQGLIDALEYLKSEL